MNVVPQDREVTRVQVRYHDMTYNVWVCDGHIIIMAGCHVVRVTPDEADRMARVLLDLAAKARP